MAFTACSVSSDAPRKGAAEGRIPGNQISLSASGEQELRALIESGRLADQQWPNLAVHGDAVREFHNLAGYRLAWSQAGRPTAQATELIGILEDADQKGLANKDYHGAWWPQRLQTV